MAYAQEKTEAAARVREMQGRLARVREKYNSILRRLEI